jgi:hypothetical protein
MIFEAQNVIKLVRLVVNEEVLQKQMLLTQPR